MFYMLIKGSMLQYTGQLSYKGMSFPANIYKLAKTIIKKFLYQLREERPGFLEICKIITINQFITC